MGEVMSYYIKYTRALKYLRHADALPFHIKTYHYKL